MDVSAEIRQYKKPFHVQQKRLSSQWMNPLPFCRGYAHTAHGDLRTGSSPGSVHRLAAPSQKGFSPFSGILQLRSPHSGGTAPAFTGFSFQPKTLPLAPAPNNMYDLRDLSYHYPLKMSRNFSRSSFRKNITKDDF